MKTTTEVHGVGLIEDGDMVVHHQRRTGKPFEAQSVAAWREACIHGGVAIDVGAYTGLYAILAAQAGASVLALEPNSAAYVRLCDNVRRNGVAADCRMSAASNRAGSARFIGKRGVELTSAGHIEPGEGVQTLRLDDLGLGAVAAIKIDTEGHECQVLEGAMEIIKRDRPLIITEALSDKALSDQHSMLAPLGYAATNVDQWNVIWQP